MMMQSDCLVTQGRTGVDHEGVDLIRVHLFQISETTYESMRSDMITGRSSHWQWEYAIAY